MFTYSFCLFHFCVVVPFVGHCTVLYLKIYLLLFCAILQFGLAEAVVCLKYCGKSFYKSVPTLSSPCGIVFTSPVHVHAVQLTVQYFFSKQKTLITPPMSQDSTSNKCVFILILFQTRWILLLHFVALGLFNILILQFLRL